MKYKNYLYAAYGSNLNLDQMKRRCPTAKLVGTSTIPNSTLLFKSRGHSGGVLDIVKKKNCAVPVALYEITQADEKALDVYEGFPNLYVKKAVTVILDGVERRAMMYVMNENAGCTPAIPTIFYYNTVIQGYLQHGFNVANLLKYSQASWEGNMNIKNQGGE